LKRSANDNPHRLPAGTLIQFTPHEFGILKHRKPGPSGVLGGYQKLENHIVDVTDRATLVCLLDPVHLERLIRYVGNYGSGGPNRDLRRACIPALARVGITVRPDAA
jgi:hypothetical protein